MKPDLRKILVVGCGAMGGLFAARLSAVAEVVGYDIDAAHVAQINQQGLRVTGNSDLQARFSAVDDARQLSGQTFDAVLLLTKSGQTGRAVAALSQQLVGEPLWVTLQNGMGNSEILLEIPGAKVARGVSLDASRYLGPGQIEHLIRGKMSWLGPLRGDMADCTWFAELLTAAGLPTEVIADPMDAVWSKFVFNCVMNPIGALLLGVNAARYEVAEVRELIDDMALECVAVVQALGGRLAFDPMDFVKKVRSGELPLSKHAGSMALDIARGSATEIDELTGFIVREAARLGLPAPVCRTVYRLVKGLERARALQTPVDQGA